MQEWAGQDRAYAVLDLLSAIRCRLAPPAAPEQGHGHPPLCPSSPRATTATVRVETDLEELARILINLHSEGMDHEEVQLLYAQHVLGYTIAELASTTGRDRRALYTRTRPRPATALRLRRLMRASSDACVWCAGGECRTRQPTDALRGRPARWRPNWWVILAVSLALIALLVETSGRGDAGRPLHVQSVASPHRGVRHDAVRPLRSDDVPIDVRRRRRHRRPRRRPPPPVAAHDTGVRRAHDGDQRGPTGLDAPLRRARLHQPRRPPRRRRRRCRPIAARPRATSIRPCRTRACSRSTGPAPPRSRWCGRLPSISP